MDNENLYRQIILDHYTNPKNKVKEAPEGYITLKGVNPSCGDELEIYLSLNDNKIKDIKFNGNGCSICCSSASIFTLEIKEKNIKEAIDKIENFKNLLQGKSYDEENFEDAIAFTGISKFPARFKCAFLSWNTLAQMLLESEEKRENV